MGRALSILGVLFLCSGTAGAAIIWTGPKITFTKANNTDWTLPQNQDRLTATVWITRNVTRGMFNASTEVSYTSNLSPAGTEWAYGTTANWQSLSYTNWESWNSGTPPSMIGKDAVLHLIADDIYLDIKFLSWTAGGGGGFSYERSTVPEPSSLILLAALAGSVVMTRPRR